MKKLEFQWKRPQLDMAKIKDSFQTKSFKAGSYSITAAVIVIAIAVVVNLLVGAIPTSYTKIDFTANKMFSISEQTEKILDGLKSEVDVYWIVQSGNEDSYLKQLLDRYSNSSKNIKVIKKDPVVYPSFTTPYTSETVSDNSLIVVCGSRNKYVSVNDIYLTDYSSYYTTGNVTQEFDGESALTSAIDYVTSDNLPIVYSLTGHGESSLDTAMAGAVKKENIVMQDLSLLKLDAVPADSACLFILSPKKDISTAEKEMILQYLKNGGNLLLITDYTEEPLPNLASVMEYYGTSLEKGIVIEGDNNYCLRGYAHYLVPKINSHTITSPLMNGNYYILMPVAQGIHVSDSLRDTVTVTKLLTTSDSAYSKIAGYKMSTYEKENGDINGPFALGVAITETVDQVNTNIVWLTTSQMLTNDANQMVAGSNQDLFLNAFDWMCKRESNITIHSKSLSSEYLTVPTSALSGLSLLLIGLIPAAFVGTGIAVVVRRRRK